VAASLSHRREVAGPHYFNALEVRKVQRALRLHSRLLPPLGFEAANPFAGSVDDAASALAEAQAQSPFQRDLHEFGLVIARLTLGLVVVVLAIRVAFGRPVLDSLMFAVALAVGLTPELLPMTTTVTLSRGALRMAHRKVIVKRLPSIHDLRPMACEGYRYSSVTCPNRRSRCLSLNLPISKSVVRLNATEPAWPNTLQSPCARCIAAAGLGQSMGSPAAIPPSAKSNGSATKRVISAIRSHFINLPLVTLREASP
jgi:hypothetical protein